LEKSIGTFTLTSSSWSGSGVWRNNGGVSYPYDSGTFHVTGATAGPTYWYFFYDMSVAGDGVKGDILMGDEDFIGIDSSSERIQFDSDGDDIELMGGNVGIGTTSPNAKLSIQTTGTTDILNLIETGGTEVMTVLENGNVGIGTITPQNELNVIGDGNFTGDLYSNGVLVGSGAGTVINVTGTSPIVSTWGTTPDISISNDGIGDTQLAYNTGQHLTTASSPSFTDLTVSGGDISITNNNGGINFNDASAYWMKTSTNWGIYWDTALNTLGFRGSGTEVASIDLDNGNAQFDGTVTADGMDANAATDLVFNASKGTGTVTFIIG